MTEQELRALVRTVVAERLGATGRGPVPTTGGDARRHPSHGLLPVLPGAEVGGPCLIEPSVPCNFCAYCQSMGH